MEDYNYYEETEFTKMINEAIKCLEELPSTVIKD